MIIGTSFHGSGSSNPREVSISNESSSWVEEGSPIPWSPIRQSNCSISCPTIRQKMMATQEWPPDPNDGTLFSRNIVVPTTTTTTEKQSSSSKSFIISVHNETYDPVRWKSIYKQGTYYETLVQERFVNILSTNHNHHHPLTSIVVDVGANIGYYTLLSLAFHYPVLSFEINPINLVRLCESLQLNDDNHHHHHHDNNHHRPSFSDRNVIFQKGVSHQDDMELQVMVPQNPGQAFMKQIIEDGDGNAVTTTTTTSVQDSSNARRHARTTTVTLDSLATQWGWIQQGTTTTTDHDNKNESMKWKIVILKLDVEGKEPQIIEGARQLLQSGRVENILTEFRRMSRPNIQEAIQTLHDTGYTIVVENNNNNSKRLSRQASEAYLKSLTAKSKGTGRNFDLWFQRENN